MVTLLLARVVARAREILAGLEAEVHRPPGSTAKATRSTPLEALSLLTRLKEML